MFELLGRKSIIYGAAIVGLVALLMWKWSGSTLGVTAPPEAIGPSSKAISFLRDYPAIPDLNERLERALEQVDNSGGAAVSGEGEVESPYRWSDLPVVKGDLIHIVLHSWGEARFYRLLRHHQLNPGDKEIPKEVWQRKKKNLDELHRKIRDVAALEVTTSDLEMKSLAEGGRFELVSLVRREEGGNVEMSLPDAYWKSRRGSYGVHMTAEGKGAAFMLKELPQTHGLVQLRESVMSDYLSQMALFFVDQGLIDRSRFLTLMESFYQQSRTLR